MIAGAGGFLPPDPDVPRSAPRSGLPLARLLGDLSRLFFGDRCRAVEPAAGKSAIGCSFAVRSITRLVEEVAEFLVALGLRPAAVVPFRFGAWHRGSEESRRGGISKGTT